MNFIEKYGSGSLLQCTCSLSTEALVVAVIMCHYLSCLKSIQLNAANIQYRLRSVGLIEAFTL